jgi:23S rRNA (adenine2503-C2)-methyltransferase
MDAGGALPELCKVLDLVDRLFRLDDARMQGIHVIEVSGNKFAGSASFVAVSHFEVLDAQAPDRRRHPAILSAMVVDAAHLAHFPANGHHFEEFALEDQVPRVVALRVEEIGRERIRVHGRLLRELEDARNREVSRRNRRKLLHEIVNRNHFHRRSPLTGQEESFATSRIIAPAEPPRPRKSLDFRVLSLGIMPAQAFHKDRNLLGKSADELRAFAESLGEPAYRGAQIYHALYAEQRADFAAMTSLPGMLRERLAREWAISLPQILRTYRSNDGTVRYVLALENNGLESPIRPPGATVETVFMPEENRQTICISTQAGCAVDCHFCLTATLGLIRNLTPGEILGQVFVALADHRDVLEPQTNVVLMGQGEPLLNYDAVMVAMRILLDPNGMAISPKHVTLSTSGIVPGIDQLAQEKIRPKLAISLNAPTNDQRDRIMPLNRKYPIEKLLDACRRYPLRPWEKLTFEYVMLGGFNDSREDARRVVKLISNLRAKVNLIPWNPGDLPYEKPDPERIEEFRRILVEKGVMAFVRYSRGQDVMAACGQLALLETAASNLAQISPAAP